MKAFTIIVTILVVAFLVCMEMFGFKEDVKPENYKYKKPYTVIGKKPYKDHTMLFHYTLSDSINNQFDVVDDIYKYSVGDTIK